MRSALSLLSLAAASSAGTITLSTTFDNSWHQDNSVVGNGFFSYDAASVLADGNYNWTSFTNPTVYIVFSNGAVFTQSDFSMSPSLTGLGVQINSGQFNFTTLGLASRPNGGAADFQNAAGYILSTSPNNPNQLYGGVAAMYYLSKNSQIYGGTYGVGSAAATISAPPVPEPSTYGLALGGLALVGSVIRRRRSK